MGYSEKKNIIMLGALILFVFIPTFAISQPPPLDFEPKQAPIDGGLGILAAAGGAYAIKKLREHPKS